MSVRDKRLYLEDLTVSFDGFKALNELTLYVDPGEMLCIIGPNGAGKTTMMDVITGKTRPDSGTAWFGDDIDLLKLSEPEIVAGRNRAEISEADRVRAVDGVREPRTGIGRQPVIPENAARPHYGRATEENRRGPGHHRPLGAARRTGKNTRARPEAVARNRHAADAESGIAAGRRAGCRHDAAGDRAHGRAAAVAGGRALGGGGRARYGLRSIDCPARHGVARRAASSPRAIWTKCRTILASSKSIWECERAGGQSPQPVLRRQPHVVGCGSCRHPPVRACA